MSEQLAECAARVFTQVLEDVAMMFGDRVAPGDLDAPKEECLTVGIRFSGSGNGSIQLIAPTSVAIEVAASFLGLDMDDPEAEEGAHDALGELLNVVVGQLLTEACGTEAVFDLSAPDVRAGITPEQWQEIAEKDGTIAIDADDNALLLTVDLPQELRSAGGPAA